MAQKKRKRTRKRRGTPGGSVSQKRSVPKGKQTKEQRRAELEARRAQRLDRPPTFQTAFNRSAIAAAVFFLMVLLIFKKPLQTSVSLALFMLVIYVPISYMTERSMYRRRQRQKQASGSKGAK